MEKQLKTPVLLIVYKRLDTAMQVFEVIRKVKPYKLYISANAPNPARPEEVEKCNEVRNIKDLVDWECEVITNYRTEHLSAKYSITSGIDWLFQNEAEGIILEDDCVVDETFFWFASELLEKYRNEESVMQICANNFQDGIKRGEASYYFSWYNHIWGWASWKRAWQKNDLELANIPEKDFTNITEELFPRKIDQDYWLEIYKYMKSGNIDTWDYAWMFSVWKHKGLTAVPQVNLIANVGFGLEATNTILDNDVQRLASNKLTFPLRHPENIAQDKVADEYTSDNFFKIRESAKLFHLKIKIARILPKDLKRRVKKLMAS